jgi:hypothetical protein
MITKKIITPYVLRNKRDYQEKRSFVSSASTSGSGTATPVGSSFLAAMEDVAIVNVSDDNFLQYNSSTEKWVNISKQDFVSSVGILLADANETITGTWWFKSRVNATAFALKNDTYGTIGEIAWAENIRAFAIHADYTNYEDAKILIQPGSGVSGVNTGYGTRTEFKPGGDVDFRGHINFVNTKSLKFKGTSILQYENGNLYLGTTGIQTGSNNIAIGHHINFNGRSNSIGIGYNVRIYDDYTFQVGWQDKFRLDLIDGDMVSGVITFLKVRAWYDFSSINYVSGILGSGTLWDMNAGGGLTFFEVDNMRVRNELRVHIFKKDIVKASNGFRFISDAAEIAESTLISTTSSTFKIVDDGTNATFDPGTLLWAKSISDDGSLQITGTQITVGNQVATGTTNGKNWIEYGVSSVRSSGYLYAGDVIVRVSGGYLLEDASSQYSPFIDIYDGVVAWDDFRSADKLKLRLGNLEGISSPFFDTISGYGLYSENVYLKGTIVVTGGNAATTSFATNEASTYAATALDTAKDYTDEEQQLLVDDLDTILENAVTNGTTIITGGYINTNFLDADVVRSTIITTDYIEGITLNFVRGRIGNWVISASALYNSFEGTRFIINNSEEITPHAGGRRGITMYNDNYTLSSSASVKVIQVGMLANVDSPSSYPTVPNYGFRIMTGNSTDTYKDVFRADKNGAFIGGITITEDSLISSDNRWSINADGTVKFTSGEMGGFRIGSNSLTGIMQEGQSRRFVIYPTGFLAFIDNDSNQWAGIGRNTFPATTAWTSLARFENAAINYTGNLGAYYSIKNGGSFDFNNSYAPNDKNIAIWISNGDIRINNGNVRTYNDWYYTSLSNNIYELPIDFSKKFLLDVSGTTYSRVNLPNFYEISNAIGTLGFNSYNSVWRFTVIIKLSRDSTQGIRVYANFGSMYDNAGNGVSYISINRGEVVEFLWDGARWNLLFVTR